MIAFRLWVKVFFIWLFSLFISISYSQLPEGMPSTKLQFTINNKTVKVPYWRSSPLGDSNPKIKRAIVAVHGINQYAKSVLNAIKGGAENEGAMEETIIVCPVFLEEQDVDHYNLDDSEYLWWTTRWKYGDLSQNDNRVSSFEILDEIVRAFVRNNPNLESIIITGFSAGGQMMNRYAAGGRATSEISKDIIVRFVPYAPSIYIYFDDKRWTNDKEDVFTEPSTSCSISKYPFGRKSNLNSYMETTGSSNLSKNYKSRSVYHMCGDEDVKDKYLDVSCGANWQGKNRFQRSRVYTNYVKQYFKTDDKKYHLPAVGYAHSASAYKAANVTRVMFPSLSGQPVKDGIYSLENVNSGLSMAVKDDALNDKALIIQSGNSSSDLWEFTYVSKNIYKIINRVTHLRRMTFNLLDGNRLM